MTASLNQEDVSITEQVLVLHVDDEPQFCELLTDYLERLSDSICVETTTTPQEALARLESEPIDCIVSDYQMPEMDGIELLRNVRQEYPNLPFFLFTGRGSEEVASEAIEAGITSYIQKGGTESYEQLVNRIQRAMNHRRSERRAKVARDRLLALYEQTDGFYILDSEWTITYWNERIAERTGLSDEAVLGEQFWDVFPEATDTVVYEQFQTAMEDGEPTEFELYDDPHESWAEVRAYPVEDGLFIHSRDISDERARDQELERRNHIIQSFASTVSHDLRNPLNVAEGKLEIAQQTGDFEHLEAVAEAHNRMRNLIDELLRLARGEELELTEVSLKEAAERAWKTVSSGPTTLVVEDDVVFDAHDSELRRLFENLFWNAIDHGDATRIRVGQKDEDTIYVEDDGTGVAEVDGESVFESGISTKEGSPGFGLSIVQGIVENHGWKIALGESESGGARFEIHGIHGTETTLDATQDAREEMANTPSGTDPEKAHNAEDEPHWNQVAQRHYESVHDDELATVVVLAIAEARGVPPEEVKSPSLYDIVDVPAIENALFDPERGVSAVQGSGTIEFRFTDYLVKISSEGWIRVYGPNEVARASPDEEA